MRAAKNGWMIDPLAYVPGVEGCLIISQDTNSTYRSGDIRGESALIDLDTVAQPIQAQQVGRICSPSLKLANTSTLVFAWLRTKPRMCALPVLITSCCLPNSCSRRNRIRRLNSFEDAPFDGPRVRAAGIFLPISKLPVHPAAISRLSRIIPVLVIVQRPDLITQIDQWYPADGEDDGVDEQNAPNRQLDFSRRFFGWLFQPASEAQVPVRGIASLDFGRQAAGEAAQRPV
jgi:hypothetical protein